MEIKKDESIASSKEQKYIQKNIYSQMKIKLKRNDHSTDATDILTKKWQKERQKLDFFYQIEKLSS